VIKLKTLISWIIFVILPLLLLFHYYSGAVKTVTKIIDGDTIYFDKRHKCRINLVDTPESHTNDKLTRDRSSCKNIAESRFIEAGLLSKKFVESFIPLRSEVQVFILDVDNYERNICKVVSLESQKDLSKALVYEGYAIPFYRFISSDETNKWTNLVMSAKKNQKGLWRDYADVMNCMMLDRMKK